MLRVDGLTVRFGERTALDGVSFDVTEGVVFGLLGPNGAGKTTLMRTLFGVITPNSGTVTWNGSVPDRAEREHWGYMPQERGLYTDMRVTEHLVWLARLHGLDKHTATRNATTLLERLGLGDRGDDVIKKLSGGMQQRVQLAAALVHEPTLLVLDEPFAGLDPTAVEFLSNVVLDHVRAGRSLVFSSHQLDLVESLCDELVVIDHGRVVLEGTLRQLRRDHDDRYLRVDAVLDSGSLPPELGEIVSTNAAGTRVRLVPGTDAVLVLDEIRRSHQVDDFGVESPRLSEMFLAAVGPQAAADSPSEESTGRDSR